MPSASSAPTLPPLETNPFGDLTPGPFPRTDPTPADPSVPVIEMEPWAGPAPGAGRSWRWPLILAAGAAAVLLVGAVVGWLCWR
jgi:hypothetical protein